MRCPVRSAVVALALLCGGLVGGCSDPAPSSGEQELEQFEEHRRELEKQAADLAGVLRVEARSPDGDLDVPWEEIGLHLEVRMTGDAAAGQVTDVFAAYADEVDAGVVLGVQARLAGAKQATLVTGEGIQVTAGMVADLVAAQRDADVVRYRRAATPVLPSVELTLGAGGLDEVVAAADRYRRRDDLGPVDLVEVESGRFSLSRDAVNEDLDRTLARERLALAVDRRFGLLGASVSGRGPLELLVSAARLADARAFTAASATARVGRVVVRASGR